MDKSDKTSVNPKALGEKLKDPKSWTWLTKVKDQIHDATKKPLHPDMTKDGHMEYRVNDRTFRDIYALDTPDEPSGRFIVVFYSMVAGIALWFLLWVLPPMAFRAMGGKRELLLTAWFKLYFLHGFTGLVWLLMTGGLIVAGFEITHWFMDRYWQSQNIQYDTSVLKEYQSIDSRLQQPEELAENYDIFPDAGMHSKNTSVTAVLAHVMLTNDGLKKINMVQRADGKTDVDEDRHVINKNVPLLDEQGNYLREKKPLIDHDFGEKLFDSAFIPRPQGKNKEFIAKVLRKRYAPDKLRYNPTHKYGKANVDTVAERINEDWYMPDYEVQRPGGMYIVDTEPNNTMVLAMTRAGKGDDMARACQGLASMATC